MSVSTIIVSSTRRTGFSKASPFYYRGQLHLRQRSLCQSSRMSNAKITDWADKSGEFKRQQSSFRDEVKKGGKFEPEVGA